MRISTSAVIEDGFYGVLRLNKDKVEVFSRYGRAIYLEQEHENIETGEVSMTLSFDCLGEKKYLTVPREEMADNTIIQSLNKVGADAAKKHYDVIVDTIRQQELDMINNGIGTKKVFTHLGWLRHARRDAEGNIIGFDLCYRADTLIGGPVAVNTGPIKAKPMGSFDTWKAMVIQQVVGHSALELTLMVGLAAVVNGLIGPDTTGQNPIFHLNYGAGTGKSSAAYLAASVTGQPFDGVQRTIDQYGQFHYQRSIYGSWSATENATVASCAGNRGAVVIFNELGKYQGNDMGALVFNLSEGADKKRLDANYDVDLAEGYATAFLSTGESSLLERCKKKFDGLASRVLEIEKPLTDSADHANSIRAVCVEHNGHAGPLLAQHILASGGLSYALEVYKRWVNTFKALLPRSDSVDRFIEKFAALILATAEMSTAALDISFDIAGLQRFFEEHEIVNGAKRNVAATSYEVVLEACRTNANYFYREGMGIPIGQAYGKIDYPCKPQADGTVLVEEYMVRQAFLEDVLKKNGFPNLRTCAREWKKLNVISYEKGRNTRSRHIDPNSADDEEVYVFPIYQQATVTNTVLAKPKRKKEVHSTIVVSSKAASLKSGSKMDDLLGDDEDDFGEKEVDNNGTDHADS